MAPTIIVRDFGQGGTQLFVNVAANSRYAQWIPTFRIASVKTPKYKAHPLMFAPKYDRTHYIGDSSGFKNAYMFLIPDKGLGERLGEFSE